MIRVGLRVVLAACLSAVAFHCTLIALFHVGKYDASDRI